MTADLERFYELIGCLAALPGQGQSLSGYTGRSRWPLRGVYFFREPGEYRAAQPDVLRIVRVGTHAVSANSKSRLWGRLRAHRGSADLGGNHRGSIFRLHVGAALLQRDRTDIGELPTWSTDQSASREIRNTEVEHEKRVSRHIGSMSVLWIDVPDDPGPQSMRSFIERNAIALLSNQLNPVDRPSAAWLGLHSLRPEIRHSGLWNLNYVQDSYDRSFLDVIAGFITQMQH